MVERVRILTPEVGDTRYRVAGSSVPLADVTGLSTVGRNVATGNATAGRTALGAASATHAGSHAANGSDPVTPAAIGAAPTSHAHPGHVLTVDGVAPDENGNVNTGIQDNGPDPAAFVDVTKTTAQNAVNTTPLNMTSDTVLRFPIAAGEAWDVDIFVRFDGEATADLKTSVIAPTGATMFGDAAGLSSGAAGPSGSQLRATVDGPGEVYSFGALGVGTTTSCRWTFRVTASTTAGEVVFQFGQLAASTTPCRVLPNSNIVAIRR